MKVGQWARYNQFDGCCSYSTFISKIKKIEDLKLSNWEKTFITGNGSSHFYADEIIKTADNLEDLLEQGDCVEFKHLDWYPSKGFVTATHDNGKSIAINCKIYKFEETKILKIIPHENLQWQEVRNENTNN